MSKACDGGASGAWGEHESTFGSRHRATNIAEQAELRRQWPIRISLAATLVPSSMHTIATAPAEWQQ